MSLNKLKLPACEKCRARKVRCDGKPPKCATCTKSNSVCIIVDPVTREQYSREAVWELQKKLEPLEAAWSKRVTAVQSDASPLSMNRTHFVGDGSGTSLFKRVSLNANSANARKEILKRLTLQSKIVNETIIAHKLPSLEKASTFIDRYSSHASVLHPFMAKSAIVDILPRVYSLDGIQSSNEDLYRIFMIFAVASVIMYRRGEISEHPYGYFRAAQRFLPHITMIGSINGIQNLLLLARFAMYYHINCSIWDISQLCMRQCIEFGLHRLPLKPLPAAEEQLRRNIFWDCYIHDRYSSGVLGRPYTIADRDIEVDLPILASEDEIRLSGGTSLNEVDTSRLMIPNDASVFLSIIKLRRITTRVQIRFFSSQSNRYSRRCSISTAGEVQADLFRFLSELDEWREIAPVFDNPSSLYKSSEWNDFLLEKDKLFVIRGAITQLPVNQFSPPRDLLKTCLRCAIRVLEIYHEMFVRGAITCSRNYFHIVFTSGLAVMYCLSTIKTRVEEIERETDYKRASAALISSNELLSQFSIEMPDSKRFALIFESLTRQYLGDKSVGASGRNTPLQHHSMHQADQIDGNMGERQGIYFPQEHPHGDLFESAAAMQTDLEHDTQAFTSYDLNLALGLEDFQEWSCFPANPYNFLGQVEAGLGEFAWGGLTDSNLLDQYFLAS